MSPKKYLRGFDPAGGRCNDSGMTILRIGSMNLTLHGIESPQFFYRDTLSKSFDDEREYDVILMNPPPPKGMLFKGAVDKSSIHPTLPSDTTKSELLFLHLILRALDMGGRAAVIVPDGVLFGSSRAHVDARKRIIEENRLDGVVSTPALPGTARQGRCAPGASVPSGIFKPHAGVSTAVLFYTRGAQTKDIWFYDMAHDGFSLDDKRVAVQENDIPDVLECWRNRFNADFQSARAKRISDLRRELTPLKAERLKLQAEINRLQFESVLTPSQPPPNTTGEMLNPHPEFVSSYLGEVPDRAVGVELAQAQSRLSELETQIAAPQSELDRLTRQFWVTKEQVNVNKYDLSASRHRHADADAAYHEKPSVTLERLARLESVMLTEIDELKKLVKG